jgi:hypothetical protein
MEQANPECDDRSRPEGTRRRWSKRDGGLAVRVLVVLFIAGVFALIMHLDRKRSAAFEAPRRRSASPFGAKRQRKIVR